jgi:hypothetical protein
MMKNALAKITEQDGAVLITSLLILVIMSLIGVAALLISSVDIKSSRLDRLEKSAFYAADAGVEIVPDLINYYVQFTPDGAGFPGNLRSDLQGVVRDRYFLNEIMGYESNNDGLSDSPDNNPDVQLTVQGRQIDLDIDRFFTEHAGGGSAESLASYEGAGTGGVGGLAMYYRATSRATTADDTTSNVEIIYRYIF